MLVAVVWDSWKEIATYVGRDIRTIQRWETREPLDECRGGRELHAPSDLHCPCAWRACANRTVDSCRDGFRDSAKLVTRWRRDLHFSFRDGYFCAWLQPLDHNTVRPSGSPVAVQHLHESRLRAVVGGFATNDVRDGYLYLTLTETTANVWMMTHASR